MNCLGFPMRTVTFFFFTYTFLIGQTSGSRCKFFLPYSQPLNKVEIIVKMVIDISWNVVLEELVGPYGS